MRTRITKSSQGHKACDHHAPIHIQILIIGFQEYGGDILVLAKFETNWMVRLREQSHTSTQHMSITRHSQSWNLTIGFEQCNEKLILVNYGHNQTIGFREMCGQSLVKVGQSWSNPVKFNRWSRNRWRCQGYFGHFRGLGHFKCFERILVILVILGVF